MILKNSPRRKYWVFTGFFIILLFFISMANINKDETTIDDAIQNPESQADWTYYRWGTRWGGANVDQANDVWASEYYAYVVGTLDANTTNPKLILSRYTEWEWGVQDWNVTWTNGNPIYGNAVWGTQNMTYVYTAGSSLNDLILIKWSSNGEQIWNTSWNLGGNFGKVHSIWGLGDRIYMSGTYINDLLLISWSENGIQFWNKTWGGIGWEEGLDVWGIANTIYTCGSTSSYGSGLNDSIIVKWDLDGNQLWNRTWGYATAEYFTSIFGFNTSLYVCGTYWNENHTSTGAVIIKWDSDGNILWNNWWDGPDNEAAYSIWANEFYVYMSTSIYSWAGHADKMGVVKYSYSGIYVDSSWPWWGNNVQYIPKGIFGFNQFIYVCGWQNNPVDSPEDDQFLYNFYSYHTPPTPYFDPITPNPSMNGTYTLKWQNFPESESYHLYRDIHPILDISGVTPYKVLTNTSYIETDMAEGTYFYIVTCFVKGVESEMSLPGIVYVNLPEPEKKVPGYNVILIITLIGFTSLWIYKKTVRKD